MSGQATEPVSFTCNGAPVTVDTAPGESLLSVLRERLGLVSVKDGCAPQGQCGCCTVLVDGSPRVACVTPAVRTVGREVTTVEGLDPGLRARLADAFVATGGSQCGFCTPGILVRAAALLAKGTPGRPEVDRALAAHLCRCTGWNSVRDAIDVAAAPALPAPHRRDLDAAARRAELEGGVPQRVGEDVPVGAGGFADDEAPRDALVAVPAPPGTTAPTVDAGGISWVVAESLIEARALAGKVQGRRTTVDVSAPLPLPELPPGGVRMATSWVEPAYLEPDASWCDPGGAPASPLANGGAFGGKLTSPAPPAARELADRYGRTVRTVLSREDCVRLGPKRPPVAGSAVWRGAGTFVVRRNAVADSSGLAVSEALRAFPLAEQTMLAEGARMEAGVAPHAFRRDDRALRVVLDTAARADSSALAGARVVVDPGTGELVRVEVRVAAGDPLDEVVLRSYCIGGAHMALGLVLTEGVAIDPTTGEPLDLTIRSFGVIRAKDTPPIDVTIVDDDGPPLARASDAVFAAVAAATWNAVTAAEGTRPETFPALATRASRRLRR
jgi:aerobic-type carbon monoxide dehydrogenase small subunit (CoxS/CutS family)